MLYKKEEADDRYQEWFLQFLDNKISDEEREVLEKEILESEIFQAIKDLNSKKSPGIDGIPNEFYLKYWEIIKSEVSQVISNIINGTVLLEKQKGQLLL